MSKSICYTIFFLILILVNACSINRGYESKDLIYKKRYFDQLQDIDHWLIQGKIGYKNSKEGGSAWITWVQSKEDFEIKLNGPLGINVRKIRGKINYPRLKTKRYEITTIEDFEVYGEKSFLLATEIENLRFWIKGLESPNLKIIESRYNDDGTLASLKQAGWKLDFSNYENIGKFKLPNRIKGKKGTYRFNLSIKKWVIK
ncbi:MAG: outer membrane lipoprotein LolB [Porticoccus sp.]|nr:outer membrane lipoprotein LolB [Porticoccus sp.]